MSALDCAALAAQIADSPSNRWLGLVPLHIGDGELHLKLKWRDEFRAAADGAARFDAGVLAFALNAACGYLIVAQTGRGGAIADLGYDLLEAAPTAQPLIIVARLLRLGRRLSTTEAEARGSDGRLIALARCSYFMAPA